MGAIFSEIIASTFLRLSEGFQELRYSTVSIILFSLSLYLLSQAIKEVPLSVAYSLWAGLGIAGTLFAGYFVFQETVGSQQLWGTLLIVLGAVMVRTSHG
jgi:multidrug resistance protein EbrB